MMEAFHDPDVSLPRHLWDAKVKHYFINRGVAPLDVDKMDSRLIKNIMSMDSVVKEKEHFDNFAKKNKDRSHEMIEEMMESA